MKAANIPTQNIISQAWAVIVFTIHQGMAVAALQLIQQDFIILHGCRNTYHTARERLTKFLIKISCI
jgi:hypothetical protein